MNIIVLAGGKSNEHDVSMSSGSQICNALLSEENNVLLLDLSKDIHNCDTFDSAYAKYQKKKYTYAITEDVPEIKSSEIPEIGKNVLAICKSADIVFFALHGGIGENGKLQALFDIFQIKYTGSGYEGSLLAMDKIITKELLHHHQLTTAPWKVITKETGIADIKLPAVVKPPDNGSSIGIEIVHDKKALKKALLQAMTYSENKKILVEDKIDGREFSVGILGNTPLPVIELIPEAGFYDYKNKYQLGKTQEITPAKIADSLTKALQETALKVHQLLGLQVYSRIDFLVDKEENIFVIEANSLPGMTPTSLLPQEAKAYGLSYPELCKKILLLSLQKYQTDVRLT